MLLFLCLSTEIDERNLVSLSIRRSNKLSFFARALHREEGYMHNKLRIVLFGVMLLSALVFSVSTATDATAAVFDNSTSSSGSSICMPLSGSSSYWRDFQQGFCDGYHNGLVECQEHRAYGSIRIIGYDQGFRDGYNKGHPLGFNQGRCVV